MADYTKWAEKKASIVSLQLDPKNPRIPRGPVNLDQPALIAELINHDSVMDLAKDIADYGYSPLESLVGFVEDDGKTYILEGNRRLAALKILLSPESAPEASRKKIRQLAKNVNLELLGKVRVLYAPSREAAAPLLMRKHTRRQIESWSPVMQARFYRRLVDDGMTPAEIAKEYGSTPSEISEFIRTDATYNLVLQVDAAPAVKDFVSDPRNFPATTLQRLLDYPKVRELLGISFDSNQQMVGSVHPDEFKKAIARILSDMSDGKKLTSRVINSATDAENYAKSLGDDLPDRKKKGSFTAADFEPKASASQPKAQQAPPKKPTSGQRQSPSVIPFGVKCQVKSTRINDVFDELRRLRLDKHPNASAVLFRILLELCIGHYLHQTKQIEPLLAKAKKDKKPTDWYPPLRHMLDAILKDTSITIHPLARKRLNKFVSDDKSPLSVDGLDSYVHSKFSPPSAKDLRSYWETFEEMFAVILVEPLPSGKASGS
jgi:hypothetical protein